jgi:hypothetical protein
MSWEKAVMPIEGSSMAKTSRKANVLLRFGYFFI